MKKIIMTIAILSMSLVTMAGTVTVGGKKTMTSIKASERDGHIKFESKLPSLIVRVRKVDLLKGMTKIGKTRTIVEIERNGLVNTDDRKVGATLDRIADGLWINTPTVEMFVTERELDKIR